MNSESDGACSPAAWCVGNDKEGIPGKHDFPHPLSQHFCPRGHPSSNTHGGNSKVEQRFGSIQGVLGHISPYSTGTGGASGRFWVLVSTKIVTNHTRKTQLDRYIQAHVNKLFIKII